jgi:hypothetical protein
VRPCDRRSGAAHASVSCHDHSYRLDRPRRRCDRLRLRVCGVRVVRPTSRGLVERFGKYRCIAEPASTSAFRDRDRELLPRGYMRKRDIVLRLAIAAVFLISAAVLLLPAVPFVAVAVLLVLDARSKQAGPTGPPQADARPHGYPLSLSRLGVLARPGQRDPRDRELGRDRDRDRGARRRRAGLAS